MALDRRAYIWVALGLFFLGVLLGWLGAAAIKQQPSRRITLSPELLASLRELHAQHLGREPSPREMQAAVEAYIHDEILYREALRRGLDKGDPVIRRRLLQSMRFAFEAEHVPPLPSETELSRFALEHPLPGHEARYSFRHVFFRGDHSSQASYQRAMVWSPSQAADVGGDPFLHGNAVSEKTLTQITASFGPEFASRLTTLTVGEWSPPIASLYGWHRIYLQQVQPADWRQYRQDYVSAWQRRWLDEVFAQQLADLRTRYNVVPNNLNEALLNGQK